MSLSERNLEKRDRQGRRRNSWDSGAVVLNRMIACGDLESSNNGRDKI